MEPTGYPVHEFKSKDKACGGLIVTPAEAGVRNTPGKGFCLKCSPKRGLVPVDEVTAAKLAACQKAVGVTPVEDVPPRLVLGSLTKKARRALWIIATKTMSEKPPTKTMSEKPPTKTMSEKPPTKTMYRHLERLGLIVGSQLTDAGRELAKQGGWTLNAVALAGTSAPTPEAKKQRGSRRKKT